MANAVQSRRIQLRADSRLDTRQRTPEGYLRAETALVRVGVMQYSGAELGLSGAAADLDHGVLFDRDAVFSDQTLASARMKPVTFGHPPEGVNINNHAALAVGHLGDDVREIDGERLAASMVLTSPAAIAAVERGIEETSIGFDAELVQRQGEHDGEAYSFRMAGPIQVNHLAIVDQGKAGPTVRIFNEERANMTDEELRKLISEAIAEALATESGDTSADAEQQDKPQGSPLDVEALAGAIAAQLASTIAGASESVEADAGKDESGSETTDEEAPDVAALAASRAALIVTATPLLPENTDPLKMSDREIIVAALGNSVSDVNSKSDDYLRGQLDSMVSLRARATDERRRTATSAANGHQVVTAPANFLELRSRRSK